MGVGGGKGDRGQRVRTATVSGKAMIKIIAVV